jgi:four helix bundle protein
MKITHHWQLDVYKLSVEAGMQVFEFTKRFPREVDSLTDQVRRSSRSVSSHITEGWRRRRYEAAFCHKLNGAEAEAAETPTWIAVVISMPRRAAKSTARSTASWASSSRCKTILSLGS